jgi:putative ABC transport system permease protein
METLSSGTNREKNNVFLAIRDIRFAKGRFAMMGGVVALITLLLVMLSGLTAGLAEQSTSAIGKLGLVPLRRWTPWCSAPPAPARPRPPIRKVP